MCVTRSSLSPASLAASRSISCTFGIPWNREIHDWMSVVSTASFSPCTSCTMRPPWRSMDGINMVAPESRARVHSSILHRCSEKWNTSRQRRIGLAIREHLGVFELVPRRRTR